MKKYMIAILIFAVCCPSHSCKEQGPTAKKVIVLYNSKSTNANQCKTLLEPYLKLWGVPYSLEDINGFEYSSKKGSSPLIIVSHENFLENAIEEGKEFESFLSQEMETGTGILSFDRTIPYRPTVSNEIAVSNDSIKFSNKKHFITESHTTGEKMRLFGDLSLPKITYSNSTDLVTMDGSSLLTTFDQGKAKVVQWNSLDWARPQILGPWAGLDDCLWRSIVWTAKKPFVMQSLPPLVTMRVDDVAGRGHLWDESPFYWVHTANKYGFKPWMSLFIYNVTPDGIMELREIIDEGKGTASPHALGRPPRTPDIDFYYYPEAIEYRAKEYDEFIFYNHQERQNFPDEILEENLKAVDEWYAANAPLPISNYLVPHHGEIATKALPHVKEKWGIEFLGIGLEPDLPWSDETSWLQCGPFRVNGIKGTIGLNPDLMGDQPEYYNGFVNFSGNEFYNSRVVIRDITGYEWEPDNNVEATVNRAVESITRSLDGLGIAHLFTHETDFIYLIKPENWDEELKQINKAIAHYDPWYMTMDDALKIVRAHTASSITSYKLKENKVEIELNGTTDTNTYFYVFRETDNGQIDHDIMEVPPFEEQLIFSAKIAID